MKAKLHPFCLAAPLLLLMTGCANVHWGDYFNAGGGPPDSSSTLPPRSESAEQPIVEEPGQRRSLQ